MNIYIIRLVINVFQVGRMNNHLEGYDHLNNPTGKIWNLKISLAFVKRKNIKVVVILQPGPKVLKLVSQMLEQRVL